MSILVHVVTVIPAQFGWRNSEKNTSMWLHTAAVQIWAHYNLKQSSNGQ